MKPKVFLSRDEERLLAFIDECEKRGERPNLGNLVPPMDTETAAAAIRTLIAVGFVVPA